MLSIFVMIILFLVGIAKVFWTFYTIDHTDEWKKGAVTDAIFPAIFLGEFFIVIAIFIGIYKFVIE